MSDLNYRVFLSLVELERNWPVIHELKFLNEEVKVVVASASFQGFNVVNNM